MNKITRRHFLRSLALGATVIAIPSLAITSKENTAIALVNNSALDKVSLSRMLLYIKRNIEQALSGYIFEPNDVITRTAIANTMNVFLGNLESRRGIYDYAVIIDESNNTPKIIDDGGMVMDIALKLKPTSDFINLHTIIKS